MRRIDAHHHLWRYTAEEFDWIGDDARSLRRDFPLPELVEELQQAGVDGTIAVQARQSLEETRFLLEMAKAPSPICGVVGWLPLAEPGFEGVLDEFVGNPLLKGVRHVVQAEPKGFLDREDFNHGVRLLDGTGLVYDILILAGQLTEAMRFVDRHPKQQFVLDHLSKPKIRLGELEPWKGQLGEMARRPNVSCKLSGLITEADPSRWRAEDLTPYVETALECFGPSRLLAGSDWPVLTVGCGYGQWWHLVEGWVGALSMTEQAQILGGNAEKVYGLSAGGSAW